MARAAASAGQSSKRPEAEAAAAGSRHIAVTRAAAGACPVPRLRLGAHRTLPTKGAAHSCSWLSRCPIVHMHKRVDTRPVGARAGAPLHGNGLGSRGLTTSDRTPRDTLLALAPPRCGSDGGLPRESPPVTPSHRFATPPRCGRTPSAAAELRTSQVQSLALRGLYRSSSCLATAEGGLTLTRRLEPGDAWRHRPRIRFCSASRLEKMGHVYQAGELGRWYIGLQAFTVGIELPRQPRFRRAEPSVHAPADGAVRRDGESRRSSTAPRPCSSTRCSAAR